MISEDYLREQKIVTIKLISESVMGNRIIVNMLNGDSFKVSLPYKMTFEEESAIVEKEVDNYLCKNRKRKLDKIFNKK